MTPEEQMAEAMQKQFAPEAVETKVEAPIVEAKVEAQEEEVKTEAPIVETKTEAPVAETKTEAPIVETKVEPVIAKSFEDYLKERTNGKFEKWEDVESLLAPKDPFANDKVKRLNELAEKGVDVTSREFLELQSLDVDKLNHSDDILFEKWKRGEEGEGLSEKTIRAEINKKYNVNEWIDKAEEDLTDDDHANMEKMNRDAVKAKDWIKDYKEERTLEKVVDPKILQAMADEEKAHLENWEKYIDSDIVNKVTKYTVPIVKDGKTIDEFSYDISDQDKAEAAKIMKGLPKDTNVFFEQFFKKGENGKVTRDDAGLFNMMLKAKNYEKAVALAYSDGAAKEALRIEKESKNTNFKPDQTEGAPRVHSNVHDAQAEAVGKMKI